MLIRLALLLLLTIGSTLVHGRLTHRWGLPVDFEQNNEVVRSFPKEIGEWKSVQDAQPMIDSTIAELGVTEHISRIYSNGTDTVRLLLMAGKTARLIRHTPNICYASTGNTFLKDPTTVTMDVDGTTQEFQVLPIRPSSELTGDFVVVYGFANAGVFKGPSNPRFVYHGLPSLEKIQVVCNCDPDKLGEIPEYAKSFIEGVCRYVQKAQGSK